MEFDNLVNHFKQAREKLALTPVPLLPPHMVCFREGEVLCSIMAPNTTPGCVAGMLAAIPVVKPDTTFLVLEVFVRAVPSDEPIGEDPNATPALIMFHVERDGPVETRVEAFSLNDEGVLDWVPFPGQPVIIDRMLEVIRQLYDTDLQNSVRTVMNWFQTNNYGVRIDPELLYPQDGS